MNIVCCFDDNYVMPTGVLLLSVCENNKDEEEMIFHAIISEELKEENRRILNKIVESYGREIHFYSFDANRFKNCSIQKEFQSTYLNLSTYYCLFLASIVTFK